MIRESFDIGEVEGDGKMMRESFEVNSDVWRVELGVVVNFPQTTKDELGKGLEFKVVGEGKGLKLKDSNR